jgi:hypothetical protein
MLEGVTVQGDVVVVVICNLFLCSKAIGLICMPLRSKAGDTLSARHVRSRDVTSAVGIFNIEFAHIS